MSWLIGEKVELKTMTLDNCDPWAESIFPSSFLYSFIKDEVEHFYDLGLPVIFHLGKFTEDSKDVVNVTSDLFSSSLFPELVWSFFGLSILDIIKMEDEP